MTLVNWPPAQDGLKLVVYGQPSKIVCGELVENGDPIRFEYEPPTTCVEVVGAGSTATLDCETGEITYANLVKIRVISDPVCP